LRDVHLVLPRVADSPSLRLGGAENRQRQPDSPCNSLTTARRPQGAGAGPGRTVRPTQVKVEAREVFGADIPELLIAERYDLPLAPMTSCPDGFHTRAVRPEPLHLALSSTDPLARRNRIDLATLAGRLFETWPRNVPPGFYNTVVSACHTAGFEPRLNEQAAGNTVWAT
jgi:DNA-binding transcriptional LysR family regulator